MHSPSAITVSKQLCAIILMYFFSSSHFPPANLENLQKKLQNLIETKPKKKLTKYAHTKPKKSKPKTAQILL